MTDSVNSAQVDELLDNMELALSPAAFIAFLAGEVEPLFQEIARENFDAEGTRNDPWPELAYNTQRRRQELGFGPAHPINIRTGHLEDYILSNGVITELEGGAEWVWPRPTSDAELSKKFKTAQRGDGRSNTPERPIVEASEQDFLTVITLLEDQIISHLTGLGAEFI